VNSAIDFSAILDNEMMYPAVWIFIFPTLYQLSVHRTSVLYIFSASHYCMI